LARAFYEKKHRSILAQDFSLSRPISHTEKRLTLLTANVQCCLTQKDIRFAHFDGSARCKVLDEAGRALT